MKSIRTMNQSGSAHVVIIVVLSVALIAALGFVFWQNFLQPKDVDDNKQAQTNSTTKTEEPKKQEYKTFTSKELSKVSFEYPAEWTVDESGAGDPGDRIVTVAIYDEKNDRIASLQTNGQLGGACAEPATFTTLDTEPAKIVAEEPTNFSLTAVTDPEGGYEVHYGLTDNYTKLESDLVCPNTFYYTYNPGNTQMNGSAFGYGMVRTKHFESMDDIRSFIASDKYAAIKKMVLSLKTE